MKKFFGKYRVLSNFALNLSRKLLGVINCSSFDNLWLCSSLLYVGKHLFMWLLFMTPVCELLCFLFVELYIFTGTLSQGYYVNWKYAVSKLNFKKRLVSKRDQILKHCMLGLQNINLRGMQFNHNSVVFWWK